MKESFKKCKLNNLENRKYLNFFFYQHVPILNENFVLIYLQRCRMNESTGVEYMGPWQIGETIEGFGGIGCVVKSLHPDYNEGNLVCSQFGWPWMEYFVKKPDKSMQKVLKY